MSTSVAMAAARPSHARPSLGGRLSLLPFGRKMDRVMPTTGGACDARYDASTASCAEEALEVSTGQQGRTAVASAAERTVGKERTSHRVTSRDASDERHDERVLAEELVAKLMSAQSAQLRASLEALLTEELSQGQPADTAP